MKADVARTLADKPERRDMVIRRMTRDLCVKNQYSLIGSLSVDPGRKEPVYKPEVYKDYSECSRAVAEAKTCDDRKNVRNNHEACRRIRISD